MLEDNYEDVITKAMVGRGISASVLAKEIGADEAAIRRVARGEPDAEIIAKIAPLLSLATEPLLALSTQSYQPSVTAPAGLQTITTAFGGDMTVNAYIVHDAQKRAVIFDTGTDAAPILERLKTSELDAQAILITHTHPDHVATLKELQSALKIPAYVVAASPLETDQSFNWGDTLSCGNLSIEARQTTGHAADGTSFVIDGLDEPLAIVGDALFAGSMGGGLVSFTEAVETNTRNLFTLPAETVVAPGHGPLTTIELESQNNPFFA